MKSPLQNLSFTCFSVFATVVVAQPIAGTYQLPTHPTPLTTTFVDWDSLVAKTTKVGQSRAVFDNPTPTLEKFEMHITTLLPKMQSHPVHQHPWEEMLLIKEGKVEVSINGQPHRAGPGFLIFFASHDPHNLTNVGNIPATYYVINFCTDLVHTVADRPAVEQAVPGKLASAVIDCESLAAAKTATGSRVSVVDSPALTFVRLSSHITTLDAGQSTARDIVDSGDELFVLKSGQLEATVNGITSRINAGSFFYCAPNDKRTFRNIGATSAAYQVIKVVSARTPK
jgi:quercetin dioxygenase-like cupin family protein